jgi:hypothetical protein
MADRLTIESEVPATLQQTTAQDREHRCCSPAVQRSDLLASFIGPGFAMSLIQPEKTIRENKVPGKN